MLRYVSYDIVFQEIPGEVTLAINISGCPNRCPGCHSPHLWNECGEILNTKAIEWLLRQYGNAVTCVCFMGGDSDPSEIKDLAGFVREYTDKKTKTAWYSGKENLPELGYLRNFDFLKLGPYIQKLGGLDSKTTNQRLYKIIDGRMADITNCFWK